MKKNYKVILIIAAIVVAFIGLGVFIAQNSQNKAISFEEQVDSAKSDINIQEKRRQDLLYNLADCVKEYDKHESETLKDLAKARTTEDNTKNATTVLKAVSEAYPELKSDENYKEFMNELSTTENLIAQYRENYNQAIKEYNRYVKKFPARLFLDLTGYEKQNYTYLKYNASEDAPTNLFD